jgi:hypothetical protein
VFILTEDEQRIPVPVGEYELEDMRILVVIEEGVIAEIREAAEVEEEVVEETPAVEEEVEATTETATPKKTIESIVKESFFSEIELLKKENEELKAQIALSTVAAEEVAPVELSEEPKPISFNPENAQATDVFKFAAKRNVTTMDTVLSRISNIK